jgi:hypothetical protein
VTVVLNPRSWTEIGEGIRAVTKRIILFRFSRDPLVCRNHVALLRQLNPGVPVCGLFGGDSGYKRWAFRTGSKRLLALDALYSSPHAGAWNWKNSDLLVAAWYREAGHLFDFEVAHLVEWDLLVLEPLERAYADVPTGAVGLTALTKLSLVEERWRWTQQAADRIEWELLLELVRNRWGYDDVPHACLGPGPCLPRAFLEQYANLDPPALSVDELRYPLFAQILRFPLVATSFRRRWWDEEEDGYFNVGGREIDTRMIVDELANEHGRRVFHPVRRSLEPSILSGPRLDRAAEKHG